MPNDPKSHARAAMLSATLVVTPPDMELVPQREAPPIRLVVRRRRAPLDLDAPIYRYRVAPDGRVSVIDEPVGARSCRRPHHHR